MAGQPVVVIDPAELARLKLALDRFEPALAKGMRREWRAIGNEGVAAIAEKLREPSKADGPDTGQGRAAIIAGTRTVTAFGKRSAGVKIVTSGSKLPEEHRGLLNAYNVETIRHPVFGRDVWVAQPGNPFFQAVLDPLVNSEMLERLSLSLDTALLAIGARIL